MHYTGFAPFGLFLLIVAVGLIIKLFNLLPEQYRPYSTWSAVVSRNMLIFGVFGAIFMMLSQSFVSGCWGGILGVVSVWLAEKLSPLPDERPMIDDM